MGALERAIALAMESHAGQQDKAGLPYILHPLRVMVSFKQHADDEVRIVAALHDVVEDTPVTLALLACHGIPAVCVDALDAISRRPAESYAVYIKRLSSNQIARRVKIADLRDNLDIARPGTSKLSATIDKRYRQALALLENIETDGD